MSKYKLQSSKTPHYWIATDKENGIVVKFKQKEFRSGQKEY